MELAAHFHDASFWCGTWHNVCFQVWGGDPSVERLSRLQAILRAMPSRFAVLTRLRLSAKMPNIGEPEKQMIAAIAREFAPRTLVSVQVVDQRGFLGSATRAILTTLSYIQRADTKTVGSLDAAADLIMPHAGLLYTRDELNAASERALASWQAPPAPRR